MKKNKTFIIFICAQIIFLMMFIITFWIEKGVSVRIFDVMLFWGYDVAHAQTFINEVSDQGLFLYVYILQPLDMVYPLLMSLFFYRSLKSDHFFKKVTFIAFFVLLFDYAENIFVRLMLTQNSLSSQMVLFSSLMTQLKAWFYMLNFLIIMFVYIKKWLF